MSNVESLLTAILTRDAQYIVVPQSRVEELLLAIYNSGGGGGGGEGGVDEFARAELLKKVDKRDGYALISTSEIERLAGVSNYDDTTIRGLIDKKVTAKNGFSLIDDTDYANFKNLKNYDDTAIKALIDKKVDDTVTVAGLKITTNITAAQLATALELSTYVKKDGNKVLSTNDFTNDYKNQIDTNTTEIEKKVNKTSVSSGENSTTSVINVTDAKAQMAMVAKISGKTRKMVQISGGFREWANTVGIGSLNSYNSYNSITWNGTNADSAFKIMVHKKLNVGDVVIARFTISAGSGTLASYTTSGCCVDSNKTLFKTGVNTIRRTVTNAVTGSITDTGSFLGIDDSDRTLVSMTISNAQLFNLTEMFGKGNEPTVEEFDSMFPTTYVPYTTGELWSAPVESVVSRGKNLFTRDDINLNGAFRISDGAYETDTSGIRKCGYVPIPSGITKITMSGGKSWSGSFCDIFADAGKNTISVIGTQSGATKTIDVPSNAKYIGISVLTNNPTYDARPTLQIEAGTTATAYESGYKTTVLVPSAVKNLPDYGLGIVKSDGTIVANEVDFENGVYHRRVASVDMSNMVWTKNTAGTPLYYADAPTGAKTDGEAVCSKFTIVKGKAPEAAGQLRVNEPTYKKSYLYTGDNSMGRPEVAEYCKGVILVYELAQEETKPLTDFIRPLPVENGGTLTLVNEHNLDVNSTIKYKKEV